MAWFKDASGAEATTMPQVSRTKLADKIEVDWKGTRVLNDPVYGAVHIIGGSTSSESMSLRDFESLKNLHEAIGYYIDAVERPNES